MKQLQFSVDIDASRNEVWETLWNDESFRDWAGLIDAGTYMVGELVAGNEVQYISSENGYGVTSLVEKVIADEYLLLRHSADTQDHGKQERDKEWTGGAESYLLEENNGVTTLTVAFDVPAEMEELFKDLYPKALERVRELAQGTRITKHQ